MSFTRPWMMVLMCLWLVLSTTTGHTQTVPAARPQESSVTALRGFEGLVRPETLAARKVAIQTRLETLTQANLTQDDLEATRAILEQQLKVLSGLEKAFQKRQAYLTQLYALPQRIEDLQAERKALATLAPRRFPDATEQLRDQYETQLQATQTEIESLSKQNAAAEIRLAGIAKEVEQLTRDREQIDKELLSARGDLTKETDQRPISLMRVELLDLRQQLLRAQVDTLDAEQQWLTKRAPLQDVLIGVARARLKHLQQILETIKQELGQAIRQEQAALTTTAKGIERLLEHTADPAEMAVLAIGLETVEIRKVAAAYRQRHNRISSRVLAQEKRNSQEKQDVDRLASLVEKYASGERVAQRLQATFARLRRERARFRNEKIGELEARLEVLTEQELEVDDRLYEFDRLAEDRLREMRLTLSSEGIKKRTAKLAKVRQALEEQKTALREKQQALVVLVQDLFKLTTLHKERGRLLDDGYRFILTKMFWLRDGQSLRWSIIQDAMAGAMHTARRLQAFVRSELAGLVSSMLRSLRFWVVVALVFLFLPWLAGWARRRLFMRVQTYMAQDFRRQTFGHRTISAVLMLFQTSIWPTYIAVVLWVWPQIFGSAEQIELEQALISGLQMAALFLWLGLLGRAIFRPGGWGQQYAGFQPDLCRFLRRTVVVGWLASLILLVPRHVLLAAPGAPETMAENLALARLCFTLFQIIVLVLVGIACRRGSCVMHAALVDSRRQHGLLWRNWPLLYVAVLGGMGAIVALDLQGYRFAARSLWLRSAEALLVILVLMAFYSLVSSIIDRLARQRPKDRPVDPAQPSHWSLLQQGRHFVRSILVLVGFVAIQHLYGLDQDIFGVLDTIQMLEIGTGVDAQPLWLTLGDLIKILLIFAGITLLVRNLPGLYEVALFPRLQWEAGSRYAFLTLSRYVLVLVALWWSLTLLHLRWSSIQWILAAASVGLGFGLQEIVSNFVSGLILLIERPISVGDFVAVGGQEGTITRITIRATTIQNLDNQTVIIPNKEFIAGQVTNWTLGDHYVRVVVPVGVAYGSDMELVRRLLTEVIANHAKILRYPQPQVLFSAFGESSLDWEVWFFVPTPRDRFTITNEVLLRIDQAFRDHGVQIPFPQRDLHLRSADATVELRATPNGQAVEQHTPVPSP